MMPTRSDKSFRYSGHRDIAAADIRRLRLFGVSFVFRSDFLFDFVMRDSLYHTYVLVKERIKFIDLSPKYSGRILVDFGQKRFDRAAEAQALIEMPAIVPVLPIELPLIPGFDVPEPGDIAVNPSSRLPESHALLKKRHDVPLDPKMKLDLIAHMQRHPLLAVMREDGFQ